jgi:hypothetical protein
MQKPPLDPDIADTAPTVLELTPYDEEHLVTYLRLLDADDDGSDWREVARIVLHIDPERHPDRAQRAFESHLARAKWMSGHGYQHLLRKGASIKRAKQVVPKEKRVIRRSGTTTIRQRRDRTERARAGA